MARPSELCLGEQCFQAGRVGTIDNLNVGDLILPFDAENDAQMSHVEGFQHLHVLSVEDPGFGAIKKVCQDKSFIHFDLCGDGQTVIFPAPVV